MDTTHTGIILLVLISVAITMNCMCNTENFTVISPRPPSWFLPENYNVEQWIVPLNQDRLSHIECLSYVREAPEILNYNSEVYRMWRF